MPSRSLLAMSRSPTIAARGSLSGTHARWHTPYNSLGRFCKLPRFESLQESAYMKAYGHADKNPGISSIWLLRAHYPRTLKEKSERAPPLNSSDDAYILNPLSLQVQNPFYLSCIC